MTTQEFKARGRQNGSRARPATAKPSRGHFFFFGFSAWLRADAATDFTVFDFEPCRSFEAFEATFLLVSFDIELPPREPAIDRTHQMHPTN